MKKLEDTTKRSMTFGVNRKYQVEKLADAVCCEADMVIYVEIIYAVSTVKRYSRQLMCIVI